MQKMRAVMADNAVSQIRPLLTPEQQKTFDENQKSRRGRMRRDNQSDDTMED